MKIKAKIKEKIEIPIQTEFIRLDAFLKFSGSVLSGGEAKLAIQQAEVRVNGEVCTLRGKKLHPGDQIQIQGNRYVVTQTEKP